MTMIKSIISELTVFKRPKYNLYGSGNGRTAGLGAFGAKGLHPSFELSGESFQMSRYILTFIRATPIILVPGVG